MDKNESKLWREWTISLSIIILMIAIVFYPAVFQGYMMYSEDGGGSDSLDLNIPRRYLALQTLIKYHEFPLWEPKLACGTPLFAESEAGILYPTILLYLLPNLTLATNLTILSAIFIAMVGTYAWGRAWKLSSLASLIGALAYGLGEAFVLRTNGLNIIHVIAWLPASLAALHSALTTGKKRYWAILTTIWALQLAAGHFQMVTLCQMGCWAYLVWLLAIEPVSLRSSRFKAIIFSIISLIFAIGINTAQLMSTYELSQQSTRNVSLPLERLQQQSYKISHLINLINPFYCSSISQHAPELPAYRTIYNYREFTHYIGLLPCLLCFLAFFKKYRNAVLGLVCLAVLFALIAMGPRYQIYYLLWKYFPQMSSFRCPCRFSIVFICFLSLISAIGAQNLLEYISIRFKKSWATLTLAIILSCSIADMAYINSVYQGYIPSHWSNEPTTIKALSYHNRVFSPFYDKIWSENMFNDSDIDRLIPMWQHRSLLGPGMASLWGVESPDDYITYGGGICLYYSAALQEAMHRLSITCLRDIDGLQEVVLSMFDWLRIQGVSHVVTPSPLPNFWPKQRFASHNIADVPELSGYQVHVYELVNPVQRVRLVPYLQKKVPTNNINIEKFLSLTDVNSLYETNFKDPPQIGSFRIISQTPHTMVVESECAQDSYLVIANTYDKNWRAMLDDISPQPVLRTNLSLQSVFVPKGNHRIKLYYYSPAFEIGWRISLASLVLFLSLILGWSIYKIKFNKK